MNTRICPDTGKEMVRGIREMTIKYKGLSEIVDMPGWYAEGVEDGIHSAQDMKVSDRALTKLKAESEKVLQANEIRRIRKKLNLTQVDAGLKIGGGPRAFQKYESGDLLPSKAISNLLLILEKYPETIEVLQNT